MQLSVERQDSDKPVAAGLQQAALEAIDAGVAIVDDAGRVMVSNRRFYSMLDRAGLLNSAHAGMDHGLLAGLPLGSVAPGLSQRPAQSRGPGGRVFEIS